MTSSVVKTIADYISAVTSVAAELRIEEIVRVIKVIEKARQQGNKVFIFGNGGSSATASHFAGDLSKGTITPGKRRIKAIALTDNMPVFSAWANDTDYNNVFAEQLGNLVEPGDVTIGISGSGTSENVLNGIRLAKCKGATTVGFTGFDGGRLSGMVDIAIVVPNHNMEQVEDIHLLLGHIITTCLKLEDEESLESKE